MQQTEHVQSDIAPQAAVEAAAEIAADIDALGAEGNDASAGQSARDGAASPTMADGNPSEAGDGEKGNAASQQDGREQANTKRKVRVGACEV